MNSRRLTWFTTAALAAAALPASANAEARAMAALDPAEVVVGQPAQLEVEIDGEQAPEPAMPHVAGLDLVPLGSSQRVTITNGTPDVATSYRYAVIASRPGAYAIPSIAIGGAHTEPVAFVARPSGASSPVTASTPTGEGADLRAAQPGRALLRVIVPRRRLVVGESVPVTVKAYFSPGTSATIEGLPRLSSDAFAVHGLDAHPTQTQENVRGVPYAVLAWHGRLTAVTPIAQDLSAEMPATLQYREAVRLDAARAGRRGPFGSGWPFGGDPFFGSMEPDPRALFNDFFAMAEPGREVSRHVTLRGDVGAVTVAALPAQGRPAGVVAVGRFEVSSTVSADAVPVGEPVTVRVAITGSGTFERVASSGLASTPAYRAYAPTEGFVASDAVGLAGTKTFEQSVIPTTAGELVLPGIPFTYYDPFVGAYVTRTTDPQRISVAPSAAGATQARALEEPVVPGLRPDRADPGAVVTTLAPVKHSSAWLALPFALVALALAVPRLAARAPSEAQRRRRARRVSERRVRAARRRLDAARRAGDRGAFFAAARAALQARIGSRLGMNPEAVTRAEIAQHPELGTEAAAIFDEADRLAFSGGTTATTRDTDLGDWTTRVARALEETAR